MTTENDEVMDVRPDAAPCMTENAANDKYDPENIPSHLDKDRIHIQNVNTFFGHKQFRKFLEKTLGDINFRKIRLMSDNAYVSFDTPEDAHKAINLLDGCEMKKNTLICKLAHKEERKGHDVREAHSDASAEPKKPKTARESVTPLADLPYDQQLQQKTNHCHKMMGNLIRQCQQSQVEGSKQYRANDLLKKIRPSPVVTGYRNKCEFTIGNTLEGEVCIGFVGGRFSASQHYTIPIHTCDNITDHMKALVDDCQAFVKESGEAVFDEFTRVGFWKMLTVREFGGDVMVIMTVNPKEQPEEEKTWQEKLVARLLAMDNFSAKGYRVTSVYWQRQANASDPVEYTHIGGAPYIYETVLDVRFRVSPSAFFQTNSQAAAVLYTTIGEACGFVAGEDSAAPAEEKKEAVAEEKAEERNDDGESAAKKAKLDEQPTQGNTDGADVASVAAADDADPGTVLLDICCGTGTIGLCLLKEFSKKNKVACVGIEIVESAVEDAKQNALDNGMAADKRCQYVAGKAEDVFRSMRYYLANGFSLEKSKVVGVLDPPRAGMHERVIIGCRQMEAMKKLVYVSCDPSAATKNIVDLCRPRSRKFEGSPFRVESVIPVDMFPQTKHVEWVVTLVRD